VKLDNVTLFKLQRPVQEARPKDEQHACHPGSSRRASKRSDESRQLDQWAVASGRQIETPFG
jgi:hypothetical protein